MIGKLIIH